MNKYLLKLYIVGQTTRSQYAIACVRRLCQEQLKGHCELVIVDVLDTPQLAEASHILATPTLVKERPLPQRRIVGDLSDIDKVLWGLGIFKESLQSYQEQGGDNEKNA